MPSLHLSDGGGQNRSSKKAKAARPLKPSIEPLPSATSNGNGSSATAAPARDGESAFCRALASGDPSTRLQALDALVAWLVARGGDSADADSVTRDDMRKLWKGMFYSYWHSDLAPVQVRRPNAAARRNRSGDQKGVAPRRRRLAKHHLFSHGLSVVSSVRN